MSNRMTPRIVCECDGEYECLIHECIRLEAERDTARALLAGTEKELHGALTKRWAALPKFEPGDAAVLRSLRERELGSGQMVADSYGDVLDRAIAAASAAEVKP